MVHVMELAGKDFKIAMTTVFNKIEEKTNRRDLKTGSFDREGGSRKQITWIFCVLVRIPKRNRTNRMFLYTEQDFLD